MHHFCMERMAFCAVIKHVIITDLQKDEISCVKDFISTHMQTITLKYSQKI